MSRSVASSSPTDGGSMGKGPTISHRLRTEAEHAAIRKAAKKAGLLPTQWMRRVLLEAAGAPAPAEDREEVERGRAMRAGERNPWGE